MEKIIIKHANHDCRKTQCDIVESNYYPPTPKLQDEYSPFVVKKWIARCFNCPNFPNHIHHDGELLEIPKSASGWNIIYYGGLKRENRPPIIENGTA